MSIFTKTKIGAYVLLLFFCFPKFIIAKEFINDKTNLSNAGKETIIGAFTYINSVWAGKALDTKLTQKYFAPDITFITNGKLVYEGYNGFNNHLKQLNKNMKGHINFPLDEVIQSGNKLVVRYDLVIYDETRKYYPVVDTSIFTLNKSGRIKRWDEIVYSPYLCGEKASKIVYSH